MIGIVIEKRDGAESTIVDNDLRIEIVFVCIIIDNLMLSEGLHVSQEMSGVNVDEFGRCSGRGI